MAVTEKSSATIGPGYEPIPGYRVETLLGRGGFGEVWRCEAPGGIKKAIKFVYGTMDEERGARELRSLNRIKGVQHPFLLTLERFDLVDGRLIIITELANGSLEDEFARQQARGSCGIPRDRLVRCMSDAADALDFLHRQHGLLHLDIKPGNLLLLSGHVKVADFGLLKDLQAVECSIVGGLTPVYAPPELFDGRPSIHSDQYSLAVIFEELLTGVRPFSGRTIAQLATQHVHSAPNLTPLKPADRAVIARALEKNPDRRFPTCNEFIEALRNAGQRISGVTSAGIDDSCIEGEANVTAAETASGTSLAALPGLLGGLSATVHDLPLLDYRPNRPAHGLAQHGLVQHGLVQHALVVGIGGVGAECFKGLRRLASESQGGSPTEFHGLFIDTDTQSIRDIERMAMAADSQALKTLYIPLKRSQEYRDFKDDRLSSISRRWIFNVPRSGQTEGMRPLGRLAMVDHAKRVSSAISDAVEDYAASIGPCVGNVYVVGSIDGGTASGIAFDIMHLLRHELDRSGWEHATILPLLATAAFHPATRHMLAAHNAACALGEMRHLLHICNGYPGDQTIGWPSVSATRSPLADAYVVAADTNGQALQTPAETIADYIWLCSGVAGDVLTAARQSVTDPSCGDTDSPSLRSVAIVPLVQARPIEETIYGPMAVSQLLAQWLGEDADSVAATDSIYASLVDEERFTADSILDASLGYWSSDRSSRTAAIGAWFNALSTELRTDPAAFNRALTKLADKSLGQPASFDRMSDWTAFKNEIISGLSGRQFGLTAALGMVDRLIRSVEKAQAEIKTPANSPSRAEDPYEESATNELVVLAELWLWRSVCQAAGSACSEVLVGLMITREKIAAHAAQLADAAASLERSILARIDDVWANDDLDLQNGIARVADRLHRRFVADCLISPIRDKVTLTSAADLVESIRIEAISIAKDVLAGGPNVNQPPAETAPGVECRPDSSEPFEISEQVDNPVQVDGQPVATDGDTESADDTRTLATGGQWPEVPSGESAERIAPADGPQSDTAVEAIDRKEERLAMAIAAARPLLLDCGGSQRMLLLVGHESERAEWEPMLQANLTGPLTTVVIPGMMSTLICEAQGIKLNDARSRIITSADGREDILARLHSRCDIAWS